MKNKISELEDDYCLCPCNECKINKIKHIIKLYHNSENIYANQVLESIEKVIK